MRTLLLLPIIVIVIIFALIRESLFVKDHKDDINLKTRSTVLFILRSILIIFLILIAIFIYETEYKISEIETYEKDQYRLVIYQVGTPSFPYGSGKCRFVLNKDGKQITKQEIELANDGKWPDSSNFSVEWKSDSVSVTAHGEEQEDVAYTLNFN